MRINRTGKSDPVKRAKNKTGGSSSTRFTVEDSGQANSAAPVQTNQALQSIDNLLALQEVDDATHAKRKAVKRGQNMLDILDQLRIDLLSGKVSQTRLDQLLRLVSETNTRIADPRLKLILEEIDLRAQVELAKFGR